MSSCLGLYVEKNLIKYAKISKERDNLNVESFGVKFYDDINEAIKQIVSETFSENIPISINLLEDTYNYQFVSNSLNKNEIKKIIDDEFEAYCTEKKLNKEDIEERYTVLENSEEKDNMKIIHVSTKKKIIDDILNDMKEYKVSTITPIGTSIANIISIKTEENILVVNMEDKTTITSIINGQVNEVKEIKDGTSEILKKIAGKENSYSKAYELCKNLTIYTMDIKDMQDDEKEYMEYIIPALQKIVSEIEKYISNAKVKYNKIYLTGSMTVINNVDLYFQESFKEQNCEILKPFFIKDTLKINIKDYIEVNSALGIAMQGLGYGIKNLNFTNQKKNTQIQDLLKTEISFGTNKNKQPKTKKVKNSIDFDLTGKLTKPEAILVRVALVLLVLIIVYSIFSIYLNNRISGKIQEADDVIAYTDSQIALVDEDLDVIDEKANRYQSLESNLSSSNAEYTSNMNKKGEIPNLLVSIMSVIPEDVQITEIENTVENNNRHIVIRVQSQYYDELGYFKVKLKEDGILTNVVSTQGEKQDEFVKMVIEGDLP